MRRTRSSSDPFTELVVMFLELPWWASIIGAVGVYLVFGLLVPAVTAGEGMAAW